MAERQMIDAARVVVVSPCADGWRVSVDAIERTRTVAPTLIYDTQEDAEAAAMAIGDGGDMPIMWRDGLLEAERAALALLADWLRVNGSALPYRDRRGRKTINAPVYRVAGDPAGYLLTAPALAQIVEPHAVVDAANGLTKVGALLHGPNGRRSRVYNGTRFYRVSDGAWNTGTPNTPPRCTS